MKTCPSGKQCHRYRRGAYLAMKRLFDSADLMKSPALLTVYRCKQCQHWPDTCRACCETNSAYWKSP